MSDLLRSVTFASLLTTVVAAATPAAAQSSAGSYPAAFADDITVTATGVATEAIEVPVPTTVISKEEMEDSQSENVSDLLRRVPGLTVLRSGDEGKVASVFTRGTESDQTLVMFDGVRLNSPYVGGYDLSLLTTSGIERVEVARGPYSALWGADAIGGVINVIPRIGVDGFSATLFGEGGEHGWQRYQGDLTLGSETFGLFLSGLHREGDGELDNSDFTTDQQLVDVGWSSRDGSRLAVVGQNLETETGIPFAVPGQPTPERRQFSDERLIAVPLRWAVGTTWTLELTASEVTREFRFSDPDDPFGITDSQTDADTRQARFSSHHALSAHTVTWGGEWREDEVTDVSNLGTNLDGQTTEVTSAFVQDVWHAGEKVQLIVGTRWDDTDEWGSETSPRAHFGWRISDTTEMRVGYGKAFRQPSLGELYFPMFGNPELEPETSSSYEVGFVQAARRSSSRWQLNVFKNELENLIQFDFASSTSRNIARAEVLGAELAYDSALTADFSQLIQVTWLDTEDDAGDPLLRRPEWSGAYTLTGSFWPKVRGDLTVLYLGSRWDVDPITFERVELGGSATVDLALGWQVADWLELTGRAVNLLDREYQAVRGYPSPGLRVMGGIRLRL
jgi:TonB-dependent vitamin B12 receptor